jgi:asparaginyl-tRNA synthetase
MKITQGWIKSIRQSKGLIFVAVTDGSKDFQVTIVEAECKIHGELKVGASFEAQGEDSKTPRGLFEFKASEFKIIGSSDDSYPIQPKAHSDDFLRTIPDLRGRAKKFQAIFKIRHRLSKAIHDFFDRDGAFLYSSPLITVADCEGAGETFKVQSDWLDANLTVSAQLQGEVGARALGRIYTFGPCFRAEKSATKKHLAEFYMVEPEYSWYHLEDAIKLAEKFVKSVIRNVRVSCEYEFLQIGIDTKFLYDIDTEWQIKTYDEICQIFGVSWGDDINSETEQKIVAYYGVPTFITHYPKDLKPFYMLKDDRVAYCFDLIFPEVGELIGGSERESSYEVLQKSMVESGLDMSKMQWYLDLRKWGSAPTSGFGLGFERLLMFITKASKIHDVIPFPVSF